MTDRCLSAVLEEAEQILTHHERVARPIENAAHEYLRHAVLKLLGELPFYGEGNYNALSEQEKRERAEAYRAYRAYRGNLRTGTKPDEG